MFTSVFAYGYTIPSTLAAFAISLLCGLLVAGSYIFKNERASRSLIVSFCLLPIITQGVVMIIHGEAVGIGAGLAIAGAFNLVRFRSIPGNAWDITSVFLAMAAGIATGTGYIYFALIFTVIVCVAFILVKMVPMSFLSDGAERELKITVPDDLDYYTELAPIFETYATGVILTQTSTTKMGSLFTLRYRFRLRSPELERKMIDELRTKNSNLPIVCNRIMSNSSGEESL
ncbi:MAG: DUF4956 domain-containing protein [Firmicutes bacterium]|nr:DUF4956 domain-containing protein [Bacillota bacterium]